MLIDVHSYANGCVVIVLVRKEIVMLFERRNLCWELLLSTQREIPGLYWGDAIATKQAEGEQLTRSRRIHQFTFLERTGCSFRCQM